MVNLAWLLKGVSMVFRFVWEGLSCLLKSLSDDHDLVGNFSGQGNSSTPYPHNKRGVIIADNGNFGSGKNTHSKKMPKHGTVGSHTGYQAFFSHT